MSMKKDLGSKLSEGVRQVKSQREQASAAAPIPAETTPAAKPNTNSTSAGVAAKPVAPRATTQEKTNLNKLHPKRVWPD